jgi:hypothetical protein
LQNGNTDIEVEKAEMIMEKKENRRLQSRIPNSKGRGRGKGKGIPGIEIIEGYKPMTTALGPRMTVSSFSTIIVPLLSFLSSASFPSHAFVFCITLSIALIGWMTDDR